MKTPHPAWCLGTEPVDQEEHVSETLHAAQPDDLTDIRLRLTQPDDRTTLALVELEFVDDDEITVHPLPLHQARELMYTMGRLLP